MSNSEQNNLPCHCGKLSSAFGIPGDGFTPTDGYDHTPTDDAVDPEAVKNLKGPLIIRKKVGDNEEEQIWERCASGRHTKPCEVNVPSKKGATAKSPTRIWIGDVVYLRADVFESMEQYPDEIDFAGARYRKSHPRKKVKVDLE